MNHREAISGAPTPLAIYWRGPDLSEGPLPAFLYFSLSGDESLYLDPFNQPVAFLDEVRLRSFSFTLPFHGLGNDPQKAMELWKDELTNNPLLFEEFLKNCIKNIDFLIHQGWVAENQIAVGGLSRGGFLAAHLAARDPRLQYVMGFAPMTKFVPGWDLHTIIEKLIHKQVRFYIGNRDLMVGTKECFEFIYQLSDAAYHHGHRSPSVELIINPSVGFKGHGTLPPIFQDGAAWVRDKLLKPIV